MDIEVHNFPTLADGVVKVEQFYCELMSKYRNGISLDQETLDWMDSANTWLDAVYTRGIS